jgi:DNA-binding response OmpR family regulator
VAQRLLSVDDDPGMLSLVRRVAADLGFEVDSVSHGSSFMAADVHKKPDVITLDLYMPDVDGIELIRWLGDVGCTARIILMSGAASHYSKMAQRLGRDGSKLSVTCLGKPFAVADLRSALTT